MDPDAGPEPPSTPADSPADGPARPRPTEFCDDGLDNDADGEVDEACSCTPETSQDCYLGDAALAGVGGCAYGTQVCEIGAEFGGMWGPCAGSTGPDAEVCDTIDNDCNGFVDDGAGTCEDTPEPVPPPTEEPMAAPRCDAAGDVTPRWVDEAVTVTGSTCGAADVASLFCTRGAAAPEAYYTWTSWDEPYSVTWAVSPGFVVGIAQADESCGRGPFVCEYEDSSDYRHTHTLVVEREAGGCGEFSLTVRRWW